jgi:hypothetical protein
VGQLRRGTLGAILAALVLAGTAGFGAHLRAQTAPAGGSSPPWHVVQTSPLKGLAYIVVSVDEPNADAVKCGLTAADLKTATEHPVLDAQIRVVEEGANDTSAALHTSVLTVQPSEGLCVGVVRVDLTDAAYFVPSYGQYANFPLGLLNGSDAKTVNVSLGNVSLLHFQSGVATGPTTFPTRIADTIARGVVGFIAQIRQENPK